MSIIAVGSLAFDTVTTTEGTREKMLGGSLTHFSNAAAFLSKPKLVGVVGEDFRGEPWKFLEGKASSLEGVEVLAGEKSFFWQGQYTSDFDTAITQDTQLNAFAKFKPVTPASYLADDPLLFLGNIDPVIQTDVAGQCKGCRLKLLDTMNFWINNTPDALREAFRHVDAIVINEGEARALSGETNLVTAGEKLMAPHFRFLILKKGSHGVFVFGKDYLVSLPAYPIRKVVDPTGAGDSFAGAFVSYLDARKVDPSDREAMKKAAVYATVVASFAVEGFGVEGIDRVTPAMIEKRTKEFCDIAGFMFE